MSEITREGLSSTYRAIMDSKAGRAALDELIKLAELHKTSEAFKRGFYRQMLARAKENAEAPAADAFEKRPVMTDDQARRFEVKRIGFGKHSELTWGDVPIDYILFLHEKQEDIGAYLRSHRGKIRQSPLWELSADQ